MFVHLLIRTKNRRVGQPPGKPDTQLPPHGGEITIAIEVTSEAVQTEQARQRERERKGKGKAKAGPPQLATQLARETQKPQRTEQGQSRGQTWAERVRADLERRSKLAAHAHENGRVTAGPGGTGEAVGMGTMVSGKATASGLGGEVGGVRPSDEAEHARFVVCWEPVSDWLGISVPREAGDELDLQVVCPGLH